MGTLSGQVKKRGDFYIEFLSREPNARALNPNTSSCTLVLQEKLDGLIFRNQVRLLSKDDLVSLAWKYPGLNKEPRVLQGQEREITQGLYQ